MLLYCICIGEIFMIIRKKRIFIITTFLIVTAIAVVLCVGYFTDDKKTEYDGTLVKLRMEQIC